MRKLCEVIRRRSAPRYGIEVGQLLKDGKGFLTFLSGWDAVAPFPGPMIGIDQQLEALEHAVVGQCVLRLLQVADQLVRLDATEDGRAQVVDKNGASADAVGVEARV